MKIHPSIKRASLHPERVQYSGVDVLRESRVDNHVWYVIQVSTKIATWVRQQDQALWCEHVMSSYRVANTFKIHENMYTMLLLRWA